MSTLSLNEEGNGELPSEQDEESSEEEKNGRKESGTEQETTKSPILAEEGEKKQFSGEEIPQTDDVVMEKSVDDVTTEKPTGEKDIETVEEDILQKSIDDAMQKSVNEREDLADKPEDFFVESVNIPKSDSELFPRELLVNSVAVTPETEGIPTASSEAIAFFNLLSEEDLTGMVYNDKLITMSEEGELGEFQISVEKCTFQDEECFKIAAKSVGRIEGIYCGTSLEAYINGKLQTLEQRHHEYVELSQCPLDRKTLITKENEFYVYTKLISEGTDSQLIKKSWNVKDLPIFILEGANTLLLRLLIRKRTVLKNFDVPTLDSDGYLCNSELKHLDIKSILINNEEVKTIGLQRTIFSKMDSPISWNYHFMDDGHLLGRTQVDSLVKMKVAILPIHVFPSTDKYTDKPIFKKQPINLDEDMEMKSKFIDKKDKFMNDFSVYLRQKPEIRSLLADFLQFLLLRKPDDVVKFAAEYFSSFSTHLVQPPTFQTTKSRAFAQNAPLFKRL